MFKKKNKEYSSREKQYCEGFFCNNEKYLLGVNFSVAKVKKKFFHNGSILLDEINAFDLAETTSAYIGQINMISVSSFCGPKGLIWGYDLCRSDDELKIIDEVGIKGKEIKVFDIKNLEDAFLRLTGTVKEQRFPFLPGSHVPCATKRVIGEGPAILYSALGIGIPVDRQRHACLLMEDVGEISSEVKNIGEYGSIIKRKIAESILEIGENQRVKYKEIYAGMKSVSFNKDEIGCALIAAPYFLLAKKAVVKKMSKIGLTEWEKKTRHNFLYKNDS